MSRHPTRSMDQLSLLDDAAPVDPPDQSARDAIAGDLAATIFVEAGAGAGKTTALAGRIVALVRSGIPIGAIAAITFTEKAAAELRQKTREKLLAAAPADDAYSADDERCNAALDELDAAPIGTLHAFAARLLREFPIEAGLPPTFTVLDEVASDMAFEERWSSQVVAMLDDPDEARIVLFSRADGLKTDGLRRIAHSFGDSWDLVAERVDACIRPPERADLDGFLDRVDRLIERTHPPDGDTVHEKLRIGRAHATFLRQSTNEFAIFDAAGDKAFEFSGHGRAGAKAKWKKAIAGELGLDDYRAGGDELSDEWGSIRGGLRHRWHLAIGASLAQFTLRDAEDRRARGELEFHDLLVLARDVITRHPTVQRALHERYQRLLIDEFQDTDPVQLDIAVRIAADPGDPAIISPRVGIGPAPRPGRLFFVGDPKQSIYRFRRADIAQYLRAAERLGARQLALTTNFRSTAAVLDWINHVFERLIVEEPDTQPAYRRLDRHRADLAGSVTMLGADAHADSPRADELRQREASDIATTIVRALREQWPVRDDRSGDGWRPCRRGDFAILLPSRLPLAALRQALDNQGIPYQAENSSVVYATSEIRSLLLALRAIDYPTHELALVSTLRSSLFGCSDRELYRWVTANGRWRVDVPPIETPDGAESVGLAFAALGELAALRHWLTPSELLHRLVIERRVLELALADPGARDTWRRVRFVIDQARAWSEAGGVGLRNYLAWARRQGDDGRYVAEAILPETDLDAVRIMTIHAAKGLEFPITIVGGMTTRRHRPVAHSVVWTRDSWTLKSGSDYEAFQPVDEQLSDAERLRLLYVACTRARDHLVVSLHRPDRRGAEGSSAAEALAPAALSAPVLDLAPPFGHVPTEATSSSPQLPWSDPDEWAERLALTLEHAARPSTLSATRLVSSARASTAPPPAPVIAGTPVTSQSPAAAGTPAVVGTPVVADQPEARTTRSDTELATDERDLDPGLAKDGVDLELPSWQRGRYGTSVGRAVHAVLQRVELRRAGDLDALAAAQSAAEGIVERQRLVAALARSALACPIVRLAADGAESWRELFVAAPVGSIVVEGYVDLLVRTPGGLVLADYKTDHVPDDDALAGKVALYRTQLAAYGVALETVLGEPVVEARLIFCRPGGATELIVPDWRPALKDLRARLTARR